MATFNKHDIARSQLETAVEIYLTGKYPSAVITLAGAAATILDALVRKAGKESFIDYSIRIRTEAVGQMPKRKSYAHHVAKAVGVIDHKHLAMNDPDTVELDLEKLATDALTAAISDYVKLNGQEERFVKLFLQKVWIATNNKEEVMDRFNALPKHLKPND